MAGKSERRRSRPLQDVVVKPLQFFLLLLVVFLAPQFLRAQMPSRQPGGPPSGPPAMPDASGEPAQPAVPERSSVIYVTDFELDSADSSAEPAPARSAARPTNDSAPQVSTSAKATHLAAQAQHIIKTMSDNLLKRFRQGGLHHEASTCQRSATGRWLPDCRRDHPVRPGRSPAPRRARRRAGRRTWRLHVSAPVISRILRNAALRC